jgi:hypothetical protein
VGQLFMGVSSEVEELGEQLHLSLPVMSDSGAPIYPSESKSGMRYSWKQRMGS